MALRRAGTIDAGVEDQAVEDREEPINVSLLIPVAASMLAA
jgi:hypothetical protein